MMRMLPALIALDADKDGTLSASEIDNATAALTSLDKNGDGFLDREELEPKFDEIFGRGRRGRRGPGGGPGGFGRRGRPDEADLDSTDPPREQNSERPGRVERLLEHDRDNNGKLSAEEAPDHLKAGFGQFDSNNDGVLSREELQAIPREAFAGRGRRRGDS
jgi:hypothetical protein